MRTILAAALATPGLALASPVHLFSAVALSPDSAHIAAIETDAASGDARPPSALLIRDLTGNATRITLPCAAASRCTISDPSWSADSQHLTFLIAQDAGGTDIATVPVAGGTPSILVHFDGPLARLRLGPDGRIAVLATENAHKQLGRAQAGAPITGEIGSQIDEQRIAVVDGPKLQFVSPPDLYVYEYAWRPDGGFAGTAAPGDGDSQWWVAKLYAFDAHGGARVLYTPPPREQLAAPVISPDGTTLAFIGGWMSDFGSTGGDAYTLRLDHPGDKPVNLTPNWHATVTDLNWQCGGGLLATTLAGPRTTLMNLSAGPGAVPLWSAPVTITAGPDSRISCGAQGNAAAAISSFTAAPEIYAGPLGHWRPVTRENAGITAPLTAKSLTWHNDSADVQGWLLTPSGDATIKRPLIVLVHGGPEAAATSAFQPEDSQARALLAQGWDVFMPNYRGSFGQGEAFAAGSIQDLGGGDWRDVLSGLDAATHATPVDETRLGIMGGSYGGYMAMWAVTQTHRFRAAFAHAGVSDWLSIEGEAPQAGSDEVNFGGSVYVNAAPYLKASPITHMRGVRTPTLITVGERDLECPMPQSQEFDTALRALGVPESFVVYGGEGHHFEKSADRDDEKRRMLAWFSRWFGTNH